MDEELRPNQQTGNDGEQPAPDERGSELRSWIMTRVKKWRDTRDQEHRDDWDEYARIWRGEWAEADKTRKSERSRIVTPATMQAVDATVSELEESTFGREQWFDAYEDLVEIEDPEQKDEIVRARDRLKELADEEGVPHEVAKMFLIGAIYGTGVGKVNTYIRQIPELVVNQDGTRQVRNREEVRVELIALEPYNVIPDPTTDDIDRMLGIVHEDIFPIHEIRQGMADGRYRNTDLQRWDPQAQDSPASPGKLVSFEPLAIEGVKITEYHGLVPASLLGRYMAENDALLGELSEGADDLELIEAIVTIANESKVLSAKANPFMMRDRSFIAYQHDTVPGHFWGRGVVEKAYNSQKAFDATVRGRIDSIALVANPMVAGDVTRLPRGMNLSVWPGKFWPTTGDPGSILAPMQFGQVAPELFAHAADMERMVQTATGAMDPGAMYSQADGAQDRALMASPFIKRARRTMQNIERKGLQPLIKKMMWRYVQFNPEFPQDFRFTVKGTLGMMAREIEQQQLTQLASLVPNESKPFMAIAKAVFGNSSVSSKAEVTAAFDSMLNPSDEEKAQQAKMQELQMRGMEADVSEKEAKAEEARAKAREALAKAALAEAQAEMAPLEVEAQFMKNQTDEREVAAFEQQNAISEEGMGLKSVDLALRAAKLPAEIDEITASAEKLRADAKRPASKSK